MMFFLLVFCVLRFELLVIDAEFMFVVTLIIGEDIEGDDNDC